MGLGGGCSSSTGSLVSSLSSFLPCASGMGARELVLPSSVTTGEWVSWAAGDQHFSIPLKSYAAPAPRGQAGVGGADGVEV